MRKKFKQLPLLLALLLILQCNVVYGTPLKRDINPETDTFLILDKGSDKQFPSRFRVITTLNISGSAQFTPPQLNNIIKEINNPNFYIIDLRQEGHGFINDIAVRFYSKTYQFKDLNSEGVLEKERTLFNNISPGKEINIYKKNGAINKTIQVNSVLLEPDLAKLANVNYKLFAVKDAGIPTPQVTDSFVNFIKNLPKGSHLHFHCKAGQGRTTTFMALYQMMIDTENLSLDEILDEQVEAGGVILTYNRKRAAFLQEFYEYVQNNASTSYSTPYSQWIEQEMAS